MNFPDDLVQAFISEDAAVFVGAGLSIGSGLPSWKQVSTSLAANLPEVPPEAPPQDVARYYELEHGRNELLRRLQELLAESDAKPSPAHSALAALPATRIFTTNWDTLIERSLEAAGRRYTLVVNDEDVPMASESQLLLIKLHGCIRQPRSIIVTTWDYERFRARHPAISRLLEAAFHMRALLLLGYSATDPDFRQTRTLVTDEAGQLARHAFAVQFDAPSLMRKELEARGLKVVTLEEELDSSVAPSAPETDPRTRALTRWLQGLARHTELVRSQRTYALSAEAQEPTPARLADELAFWLEATRAEVIERKDYLPSHVDVMARTPEGLLLLVRCVAGEVRRGAVQELEKVCRQQGVSAGWAVSETRASPAAREYAGSRNTLKVFTLAEFLQDTLAPYRSYLDERIQNSGILKYYVDLACSKPIRDDQHGLLDAVEYDRYPVIDDYIDSWLNESGRDHISILGEFGQGKTWFCLRYAHRKLEQYMEDPRHRLPLLIPLRLHRHADMRRLIPDLFVNTYGLHFRNGYEVFDRLNRAGRLLVILDGFDEMTSEVDYQVTLHNYRAIADMIVPGRSKLILTSRSPYFRDMFEEQAVLEGEDDDDQSLESWPHFEVIYIDEFTDAQIAEVVKKRVKAGWKGYLQRIRQVYDLPNLAQRPVMLDMIISSLPELKEFDDINYALLYETYTDLWINKEIHEERALLDAESKRYFAQEVAWDMFKRSELTIHADRMTELVDRYLRRRVRRPEDMIYLEHDARTASFISSRDAQGNYEFMHRSFMEFFVAQKLATAISAHDKAPLSDQLVYYEVLRFLDQMLRPEDLPTLSRWRDDRRSSETLRANCIRLSGQWVDEQTLHNLMVIAQDRDEPGSLRRDAIRSITRILRGDEGDWGEHDIRVTLWAFAIRTTRDTLNVTRLPIRVRVVDPEAATGQRARLVEEFSSKVATMLLECLNEDEPEEVRTNASYALVHLPGSYEADQLLGFSMSDASEHVRFNCCTALIAAGVASARVVLEGVIASAEDSDLVRLGESNLSILEQSSKDRASEDTK